MTTKWLCCLGLLLMAVVMANQSAMAQNKWQVALRPAVNFPTEELGEIDLETGYGFDASIGYQLVPSLWVNAGWGWNHFTSDQALVENLDFEETGYMLGLQLTPSIGQSRFAFVVGGSAIYNHIEVEDDNDVIFDTDHGWGWQAEAGISIPFGPRLQLTPTVRYHSLKRDVEIAGIEVSSDLRYVSGGVSVALRF